MGCPTTPTNLVPISIIHHKTRASFGHYETTTKLRHEVVAANQKNDKLEKLVEDLRADIPSLVQPNLDSKVAAYVEEKLEVKDDI